MSPKPNASPFGRLGKWLTGPLLQVILVTVIVYGWGAHWLPAQTEATLPFIRGRVVDEQGKPVPRARVGLYLKAGRWEHKDPLIRKITTGEDATFAFNKPRSLRPPGTTSEDRGYVLLADHPKYAVGWRNIPARNPRFEGDIVLTFPVTRSFTVTDEKGRPMSGATVTANDVGDPSVGPQRLPRLCSTCGSRTVRWRQPPMHRAARSCLTCPEPTRHSPQGLPATPRPSPSATRIGSG